MTQYPRTASRLLISALVTLLAWGAPARAADSDPADSKRRDEPAAVLKRSTWGKVSGWVLDARTRRPVPAARVSVQVEGEFATDGRSVATADRNGRYAAKAPLGKISTRFDWGRLLTMHPLGILLSPRSVTKQTRILDVTALNVRVEADGYRPFTGRVRAASLDAESFGVTLDDVWLAPADAALVSFTPGRLRMEVVEGLTVEPVIAEPGQKVKITLTARLPDYRGHKYKAYVTSSSMRVVEDRLELKQAPREGEKHAAAGEGTLTQFTREVTMPRSSSDQWTEVGFFLVRNNATVLSQRDTKVLLQVVRTPAERTGAERVATGYALARIGDVDGALAQYVRSGKLSPDYALGYLMEGDLCTRLGRHDQAVAAYRQLVRLQPRDFASARTRLALALLQTGEPDAALAELAEAERVLGKGRVPATVALVRAQVYAATGKLDQADTWLTKAGEELQLPDEAIRDINLKRARAAVDQAPDNADLRLGLARALGPSSREGAIAEIRRAAELDPGRPWAFLDLGSLLWDLGRRDEALTNLEHALKLAPENPETLLTLADAYRDMGRYGDALPLYRKVSEAQELNLRARHGYALMLYAAGDLNAARRELLEVVRQAVEKGELQDDGIPGLVYFGPKRRLAAGFSIPEAATAANILDTLQELERQPESALAWRNLGADLLELNLPGLACAALQRSLERERGDVETRFLLGRSLRALGQGEEAARELQAVVAANPLHPKARLELAQLQLDRGNVEAAQAELAAHGKNYPFSTSPKIPTAGEGL